MAVPRGPKDRKTGGRFGWKKIRIPLPVLKGLIALVVLVALGTAGSFVLAKHRGEESFLGRLLTVLTKKVDERIKLITTEGEEEILAQRYATLTFYSGSVEVQKSTDLSWKGASEKMQLASGDRVRTFRNSRAEITFDDGNILRIKPDSLIVIGDLTENVRTRVRKSSVRLLVSNIEADIKKSVIKGSQFRVEMPSAVAEVEKARFSVQVGEDKGSQVKVYEGKVGIDTGTERVELDDRKSIIVSALKQLGKTESVMPGPRIERPSSLQRFFTSSDGMPVEVRWEAVRGAASYRLEIATDRYFDKIVFKKASIKESGFKVPELGGNVFFLRVAAMDGRQRMGDFSEPVPFRVIVDKMPPHLEVTKFVVLRSAAGNEVLINGETEPLAAVEIGGRAINVDENGTFSTVIKRLSPGQKEIEIIARDRAGNVKNLRKSVET